MTPKHEDPAETAAWSAAMCRTDRRRELMIGTDTEVIALYPRGLAPLLPDALTVHGPPPLLTRCDECPDYGCRVCTRTATDTTGRPLWSPDAILATRQPMTEEQLEELREQLRRAPNQGRVYLAPTPPGWQVRHPPTPGSRRTTETPGPPPGR
jgi:hypothetical protein